MENDGISVLMSVCHKDKPEFFVEAIESVLTQTLAPKEIVIIIDGHIDCQYEEIIYSYEKKYDTIKIYRYEENRGLWYALNFGVNKCNYNFIARMDSDDICVPYRFEKQMSIMKEKKFDLVGCNTIEFENDISNIISRRLMPENHREIFEYSKKRNPFIHPSVMIRKNVLINSGSYQKFLLFEDYHAWVQMIINGAKCYNIQENLVYMRVDKDFYKRRGGLSYIPKIIKFFNFLLKKKYINLYEYFFTLLPRLIICIVPSCIREKFYKRKLRNKG